jgi:hypothetical protein
MSAGLPSRTSALMDDRASDQIRELDAVRASRRILLDDARRQSG